MNNEEKLKAILPWIDPEERVTVNFLDEQDLNGEVTGCNDELVDISLETHVLHVKQHISVPLRRIEVSEDPSHYTRNPERPLKDRRLMLLINDKRPPIIY
ncbi:MAG TPA: hypothetical protein VIW47_15325 [Nitrospiraceae bacterium]|jgi:hypothetical protein